MLVFLCDHWCLHRSVLLERLTCDSLKIPYDRCEFGKFWGDRTMPPEMITWEIRQLIQKPTLASKKITGTFLQDL